MSFEFSKFNVGEQLFILLTTWGAIWASSNALDDFFDNFFRYIPGTNYNWRLHDGYAAQIKKSNAFQKI